MPLLDIILPKLGESVTDATILKWLVQKGDKVFKNQVVGEVATDKVDSEIYSDYDGIVEEILYNNNDVVKVGEVVMRINSDSKAEKTPPPNTTTLDNQVQETPSAQKIYNHIPSPSPLIAQQKGNTVKTNTFLSPLVVSIIQQENIPWEEVSNLVGSGEGGRVTKKDILEYIKNRNTQNLAPPIEIPVTSPSPQPSQTDSVMQQQDSPINRSTDYTPNIQTVDSSDGYAIKEVIEMDRVRKLISKHMLQSQQISAHVTSFSEADVTNIYQWRSKNKREYIDKYGQLLTLTPLFIEATVEALRKFPLINSSIQGDKIVVYRNINMGLAVAMKNNNLIVPVIKNAQLLTLEGIVTQMNMLIERARQDKLQLNDIQGGTFTLSNIGNFGSMMGTPIINQPQVAILATGTIKKKPMVVEGEYGDIIAIRHHMFLSLSYDHRIIDGALGSMFLKELVSILEGFNINRPI